MSLLSDLAKKEVTLREPKGIVYASVGVGKTIFGLNCYERFVLNTENGAVYSNEGVSPYLDSWKSMLPWVEEIAKTKHEYKTFVVDTIDWLLRRIEEHISTTGGKGDPLDSTLNRSHGGYGNGKQVLQNYVYSKLLPLLDEMVNNGIAVILLAHSVRQSITNSDGITIEKTAPAIHPHLRDTIIEWCDFVGMAKIEKDDRVLHLNETGQYLAKNRYGITRPVELDYKMFRQHIVENFPNVTSRILKKKPDVVVEEVKNDLPLEQTPVITNES